jgi:hypothetical protein
MLTSVAPKISYRRGLLVAKPGSIKLMVAFELLKRVPQECHSARIFTYQIFTYALLVILIVTV